MSTSRPIRRSTRLSLTSRLSRRTVNESAKKGSRQSDPFLISGKSFLQQREGSFASRSCRSYPLDTGCRTSITRQVHLSEHGLIARLSPQRIEERINFQEHHPECI